MWIWRKVWKWLEKMKPYLSIFCEAKSFWNPGDTWSYWTVFFFIMSLFSFWPLLIVGTKNKQTKKKVSDLKAPRKLLPGSGLMYNVTPKSPRPTFLHGQVLSQKAYVKAFLAEMKCKTKQAKLQGSAQFLAAHPVHRKVLDRVDFQQECMFIHAGSEFCCCSHTHAVSDFFG